MSTEVSWSLRLQDFLTDKLKIADQAASNLSHNMDHLKEKTEGFGENMMRGLETLGIGFAIFEAGEFFHKGIEAFHNMEQANAQLEAGLESTEGVAGMTMKSLQEGADKIYGSTLYSMTAIKDMQAQLLTFPAITKETFGAASDAILNMATRTHHGVDQMSIALGKALQDPAAGIMALHRVGVNFTKEQKEMVKTMVETGHMAQAQNFILKELSTEFAGSATAAFNADPLAKYNKEMEQAQLKIGQAGEELVTALAPALIGMAHLLKDAADGLVNMGHWLKENSEYIKAAGIAIGILSGAWLIANASMILATGAGAALTAVLWLLDAAAAANPVGILITGIALLASGLYLAYEHSQKFRAALSGIGAMAMSVAPIFRGLGDVILGALTLNPALVKQGMEDSMNGIKDIARSGGIGGIFSTAYDNEMNPHQSTMAKTIDDTKKKILPGGKTPDKDQTKGKKETVSGHKSYTINIKIDNLVKSFSVQTTNMTEGAGRVKDMVAQALMSAVNDSQIIAGQ